MVVAAEELRVVAPLVHGRAAELPAPDHERRVEQAALLQVLHQGGRRLIDLAAQGGQPVDDVVALARAVVVPAAVIELHEAHAALDEPARERGSCWRRSASRARLPYMLVHRLRLLRDVGQLGDARLHAEGHLVGRDARVDLGIAGIAAVERVHLAQRVQRGSPVARALTPSGLVQEQDGIALRAELDALVDR